MHTRWIETEWDNTVAPFAGGAAGGRGAGRARTTVVVEVGGKRLEVTLPAGLRRGRRRPPGPSRGRRRAAARPARPRAGGDALTSPMQGTIVKVAVADGDQVAEPATWSSCSRR